MSAAVRIAVVGVGKLGLLHAATFNVLEGSLLAAVVDPSRTITQAVADRIPGVRQYADHKDMLVAGGVDAVVVAAPTHLHVPIGLDCVEAGLPVFLEKPLSLTADEGRRLLDLADRRKVPVMVGYMTRHHETFRKAREIIASGALGAPQLLRATMYVAQLFAKGKGWRYEPGMSGGGVLMTQNTHLLDMLLWFFGPVVRVSGHAHRLYSEAVEDHIHLHMDFASGMSGFLDATWSMRGYRMPVITINVQGANGQLEVSDDEVVLDLDAAAMGLPAGRSKWRKPDLYEAVPFDIGGAHYTRQALEFLAALRGEGHIGSDLRSSLDVQHLVDAAYASADAGGAPVNLETAR